MFGGCIRKRRFGGFKGRERENRGTEESARQCLTFFFEKKKVAKKNLFGDGYG
jgi:hypothetical protein